MGHRARRRQHRLGHGAGDNIVWGTEGGDNIVWGTVLDGDNIVWGTDSGDNIVWGTETATISFGEPAPVVSSSGPVTEDGRIVLVGSLNGRTDEQIFSVLRRGQPRQSPSIDLPPPPLAGSEPQADLGEGL